MLPDCDKFDGFIVFLQKETIQVSANFNNKLFSERTEKENTQNSLHIFFVSCAPDYLG